MKEGSIMNLKEVDRKMERILKLESLNNSLILDVSNGMVDAGSFGMAIFMEAFCSIHMSVFVLIPLSKMISKDNDKKVFIILFL